MIQRPQRCIAALVSRSQSVMAGNSPRCRRLSNSVSNFGTKKTISTMTTIVPITARTTG